jgi:transporter family-2 protein
MEALFVPLSLAAGGLLAVQAGANTQLSKATGSPFAATALQLAVGALLLLMVTAFSGTLSALAALPRATWWHTIGGTASAFYVVSTILLFPRLGAVVSVGLFIAGQMLASLLLDSFAMLGISEKALTLHSVGGTLLVLLGAAAIVFAQGVKQSAPAIKGNVGWIVLALLAGAVLPIQGAVNALLRADLRAPFAVGATSFMVATMAMTLVLLIALSMDQAPKPSVGKLPEMPWWGWLGGIAGAIYVTTVFTAIPVIGASAAVGFTVAGQQIASVLVDRYGWLRLPRRPVSGLRLAGVLLLLAGVALIKF